MIKLENLTVSFGSSMPAVDHLSLDIIKGKTTVIVGESGSGKSITILAILGMLPAEAKVEGSIKVEGKELLGLSRNEMNSIRGRTIGYVPQGGGNTMNPLMTVGAQIAEPMIVHAETPKKTALSKAEELMNKVGLIPSEEIARSYPHMLSGGMKQRALTVMGTAGGAEILLCDEPTKGLDEKRIRQAESLFESLAGTTILCVTHDLRFAERIADRICVLYGGKAAEIAEKESFFRSPKHPYSRMLLAALPENGLNCPDSYTPASEEISGCSFYGRCPIKTEACLESAEMKNAGGHSVRCHADIF